MESDIERTALKQILDLEGNDSITLLIEAKRIARQALERPTPATASEPPQIKNLKMLDSIYTVVLEHSGNEDLANQVFQTLVKQGIQGCDNGRRGIRIRWATFLARTIR